MLDPYRMIVVNVISLLVIFLGSVFYKFIYPKKNINYLFFIILICILPTISILRIGAYESGDFNIHIYRTMEFYTSLTEGNIMPSWAGNLNASYGYPLHIFNYVLPYYVISFFHWIGMPFIGSLKLFLALNIFFSGIFMFLFSKQIFKNNLAALTSSIFYIFSPYHLIDIHFKIVIGEILFFTILPLFFLSIFYLQNKKNILSILFTAISYASLIMSHLVLAIFTGILIFAYTLFNPPKNNFKIIFLPSISALAISLLISLPTWLGSFLLSKYSFVQNIKLETSYFPTLQDLLYSPWRMGLLFQGPEGQISHLLGYAHIFSILLLIIFIYRKKVNKKILSKVIFWIIAFFVTIFFILPYSKFIWETIPIIKAVGSHRLLLITSFISSVIAGYFVLIYNKKWMIYLLIFLAIISTILNWGQRKVIPEINDAALIKNIEKSTFQGEAHFYANTKWVDVKNPWFSNSPKNHLEIITGNGKIKDISRNSTSHKYMINAVSPLKIQENTLYFPGWKGFINKKEISLFPSNKGIIQAYIPQGISEFEIKYEDILVYKILKIISITTLAIVFTYLIIFIIIKYKLSVKILNGRH